MTTELEKPPEPEPTPIAMAGGCLVLIAICVMGYYVVKQSFMHEWAIRLALPVGGVIFCGAFLVIGLTIHAIGWLLRRR